MLAQSPTTIVRLEDELKAAGLPISGIALVDRTEEGWFVVTRTDGVMVRVDWTAEPSQAQKDQATSIIQGFNFSERQTRKLCSLVAALDALSAAQKSNVAAYMLAVVALPGAPNGPRWKLSDRADVWTSFRIAEQLSGNAQTQMRILGVASIVRDENQELLVNPSFDASINVPGWENV